MNAASASLRAAWSDGDEVRLVAADPHPLAAAAGRGLDQDGVADRPGEPEGLGVAGDRAVGAGDAGDLGGGGDRLGLGLQAHLADRLVGRADELEVAAPADLGEVRVLAQEAVAGVDRLDVGHLGGGDDPGDVQVAVGAGGLADADRPVGQRQVRRVAVGLRVDGDDLDAQLLAGADDPQGDLAAVGHQDSLKHRRNGLTIGRDDRAIGAGTRAMGVGGRIDGRRSRCRSAVVRVLQPATGFTPD